VGGSAHALIVGSNTENKSNRYRITIRFEIIKARYLVVGLKRFQDTF